jgi:hypothetical protein
MPSERRHSRAAPVALLLASQRWPTAARLGLALHSVGFRICIWCPRGHPLLHAGICEEHFAYGALDPLATLEGALRVAEPDLLIPCDDLAMQQLQRLVTRATGSAAAGALLPIIEKSLGAPRDLRRLTARADVLDVASAGGVAVPNTAPLRSSADLRQWFAVNGFPAYLKADGTFGGMGVRSVETYEQAERAYGTLDTPPSLLRALKRLAYYRDTTALGPVFQRQRPALSVQQAMAGTEATSAIFCWKGRVLASITVEVLATSYRQGPSTVVRRIANAGMDLAASTLAERLQLSGFHGLDFILDGPTGTPWLLEMNSRATQVAHLALGPGRDLAAAALAAVTGTPEKPRAMVTTLETIALFPQEWQRDASSPLLAGAYHDVPWESPDLARHFLNQRLHKGWSRFWRQRGPVPQPEGEGATSQVGAAGSL